LIIKSDKTETGVFKDKHWRSAGGWFSYQLKNSQNAGKKLRVIYYGTDKGRFDIFINGNLLKKEELDGSKGASFFNVDYVIPDNFLNAENVEVKFSATGDAKTARIFYVRLMK
jgi:hypothetical protein